MNKPLEQMTDEELLNEYERVKRVLKIYSGCMDGSYECCEAIEVAPVRKELERRGLLLLNRQIS